MMELPNGVVTFLFTDIAGSTRLWEQSPEIMRQSLQRHDALVEECIRNAGGLTIKPRGEGDSFFAVFNRATEAVTAATYLQQCLDQEEWHPDTPLKVRVALHTGEADLRDGDYYGPTVNRCARLRSIGHGGQVLLSHATYELVQDSLPEAITLQNLGRHRLRDLQRPEEVFQLIHPDLPSEFPPLRSLNVVPNNLPQQLTSFVGREQETREVMQLLKTTRLLTLTGTGGCGKTRLALQAAVEVLENYTDGVWFIDLAPVTDPNLISQTVAKALNVKEEPGCSLNETLLKVLHNTSSLLVFDNLEHLMQARDLLSHLLQQSNPSLRVLVTSREILRIPGETILRVPSLSIPSPHQLPTLESLTQYEAVRLFVERAAVARPSFSVTSENAPAVAQICHRLDGIPLAIELAAARIRVLTVDQINQRLNERFRLLTGGSRTLLPRQQTLRALLDWGYNLLSEAEKKLCYRLSVFVGGWSLDAAEAVCTGDGIDEFEVLDLLSSLIDRSMVVVEEKDMGLRYRFLETIRQYGQERLLEGGEKHQLEQRYSDFFSRLAEEAAPKLQTVAAGEWLAKLDVEMNNLRAVLRFYERSDNRAEAGLTLVLHLVMFWTLRGHWVEGREWLEKVLAKGWVRSPKTRTQVLDYISGIALRQGDYDMTKQLYEDSLHETSHTQTDGASDPLDLARQLFNLGLVDLCQANYPAARSLFQKSLTIQQQFNDRPAMASSLYVLGLVAEYQVMFDQAQALYNESIQIWQETGDRYSLAYAIQGLGNLAEKQGDYDTAQSLYQKSLDMRRELGDRQGIAFSLICFGSLAERQGNYDGARSLYNDGLSIQRELGDRNGMPNSLIYLGRVAEKEASFVTAQSFYKQALAICREQNQQLQTILCLEGIARVQIAHQTCEAAVQLLSRASVIRKEIECPVAPFEQELHDQALEAAQAQIGTDAFNHLWTTGQTLSLSAVMEEYLAVPDPT
ncbi:MAG: tetratricopeptide repeat protein [Elainellaceae cyanobacterium]